MTTDVTYEEFYDDFLKTYSDSWMSGPTSKRKSKKRDQRGFIAATNPSPLPAAREQMLRAFIGALREHDPEAVVPVGPLADVLESILTTGRAV